MDLQVAWLVSVLSGLTAGFTDFVLFPIEAIKTRVMVVPIWIFFLGFLAEMNGPKGQHPETGVHQGEFVSFARKQEEIEWTEESWKRNREWTLSSFWLLWAPCHILEATSSPSTCSSLIQKHCGSQTRLSSFSRHGQLRFWVFWQETPLKSSSSRCKLGTIQGYFLLSKESWSLEDQEDFSLVLGYPWWEIFHLVRFSSQFMRNWSSLGDVLTLSWTSSSWFLVLLSQGASLLFSRRHWMSWGPGRWFPKNQRKWQFDKTPSASTMNTG